LTGRPRWRGTGDTLLAVAAGGALGGSARYTLLLLMPHEGPGFPWATFTENVAGSFAMGALVVLVTEVARPHRLLRPFLGVGVLGGFTTFSTYAVDIVGLVEAGAPGTALAYLAATLVGALAAVWAGMALTRTLAEQRRARSARASRKEVR
jgi:CrcB protein